MNRKERARLRRRLREEAKQKETEDGSAEKKDDEDESMDGSDDEGEEEDEEEKEEKKTKNPEARILAVDWALSKEKWEEAKAKISAEQEDDSAKSEEDAEMVSGDEESESDEESEEDVGSEDEDEENRSDADEPVRPTLPQTDVGTTLFVRNVPFDATEEELRVLYVPGSLFIQHLLTVIFIASVLLVPCATRVSQKTQRPTVPAELVLYVSGTSRTPIRPSDSPNS